MHREDLDILPIKKIEEQWERQPFMVGKEKIEEILAAYKEMGIRGGDVYLRRPRIEELECERACVECFRNNPEALEDCVMIYLRRK